MIPKTIHYCWLGKGRKSSLIRKCINSWRKVMPEWTFIEWNEENFDTESLVYVKEAIAQKKYAFATDYIRLYALYNYGGIYLDTDILLFNSLEPFRTNKMFTAHECFDSIFAMYKDSIDSAGVHVPNTPIGGFGIMSAVIGAEKGHWFIKECMDYYQNMEFKVDRLLIIDGLMASMLEKYGYRYKDELQILKDIAIYSSETFLTDARDYRGICTAIHWCSASWTHLNFRRRIIFLMPYFALKYFNIRNKFRKC